MWHHSSSTSIPHLSSHRLCQQPSPEPSKAISTMPPCPPAHLIQGTCQLPSCTKLFWRHIIPQSSSLLAVLVRHVVQMGSGQQMWAISSSVFQDGSKEGDLALLLLLHAVYTALLRRHLGSQRTRGKVKKRGQPCSCFPFACQLPCRAEFSSIHKACQSPT